MTPRAIPPISIYEEHEFWTEILEDHAWFLLDHLSPTETRWVELAERYIQAFRQLRERLTTLSRDLPASAPEMVAFAKAAYPVAAGYFQFEGHMQALRIKNEVNLTLSPTYFNGTLNENQEYVRQLTALQQGVAPAPLPVTSFVDIWLEDQIGHALLLRNGLDPVEQSLSQQIELFMRRFQMHQLMHHHIKGYLRFLEPLFPAHRSFLIEVSHTVVEFQQLVEQAVEEFRRDELINRTTLQFLGHHYPETCYTLRKLAAVVPEIQVGTCSLTKPEWAQRSI